MTKFLTAFPSLFRVAAVAGVAFVCAFAQAQAPAPGITTTVDGDEKITVNFVNADIQSVIKSVGQHTGRNFILDPRVTGTVNIVSDRPVSKDMLYSI
ncbi:MAG TPA: hypothetical protein VM029_05980, partial [Opitutaceae bacterium]|nr:hypothetical protein [Opitutaceae bacterium]